MDTNEREEKPDPKAVSIRVYWCPFAVEKFFLWDPCHPTYRLTLNALRKLNTR
jgi:hypothetical protein